MSHIEISSWKTLCAKFLIKKVMKSKSRSLILDLRLFAIQTKKWMSVWEHLSIWLQSFVEWSSMTSELMSGVWG